ncbi:MAG: hypothetical protein ABSG03_19840 [Bryobacteraceae bacterium]|jgi:hypothetical protein
MPGLRNGSWVALLAIVASSASYANAIGASQVEFRQIYSLVPNGRVTIQNQYGNVSIMGWDRDEVLVEAVKLSNDPRRLDDARIVVEPVGGALSIRTEYSGADTQHAAQHAPKVEYRILVPRYANLEDVKLGNGGLVISGVAGTVKASSVNGNIKAEKLEGRADLSTVNGLLEADFDRVGASHPITLSSVNGPIKLLLPWGTRASLNARNVSGGIDTEFGHPARVNGAQRLSVVQTGGPQIRLTNVNGGISIHSSWSRRPERPTT